jgi:hypothetical protein
MRSLNQHEIGLESDGKAFTDRSIGPQSGSEERKSGESHRVSGRGQSNREGNREGTGSENASIESSRRSHSSGLKQDMRDSVIGTEGRREVGREGEGEGEGGGRVGKGSSTSSAKHSQSSSSSRGRDRTHANTCTSAGQDVDLKSRMSIGSSVASHSHSGSRSRGSAGASLAGRYSSVEDHDFSGEHECETGDEMEHRSDIDGDVRMEEYEEERERDGGINRGVPASRAVYALRLS